MNCGGPFAFLGKLREVFLDDLTFRDSSVTTPAFFAKEYFL